MRVILLILSALFVLDATGQTDIQGTLFHDGITREYKLHLPQGYDAPGIETPLVLALHGYTNSAQVHEDRTGFSAVSDTAGFAVVYPEGLASSNTQQWNVGWFFNDPNVDDVGFLSRLADTLVVRYGLDASRVYAGGYSNGGFMSYRLACERPRQFAAVGSVAGGMVPAQRAACSPSLATPAIQVHGTSDAVIRYVGSSLNDPIETTVAFWANENGCNDEPVLSEVEDGANDGLTSERRAYRDCAESDSLIVRYGDNVAQTELIVTEGGEHRWPGSSFGGSGSTNDFSATQELWRFFRQFARPAVAAPNDSSTSSVPRFAPEEAVAVWPNPVGAERIVHLTPVAADRSFELLELTGRRVALVQVGAGATVLVLPKGVPAGTYVLRQRGLVSSGTTLVVR